MARNVYNTVTKYLFCTKPCQINKRRRKLRTFSPFGPLEIDINYILGFLMKNDAGNQSIVVMVDRSPKPMEENRKIKSTAVMCTIGFLTYCLSKHLNTDNCTLRQRTAIYSKILGRVLRENGRQYGSDYQNPAQSQRLAEESISVMTARSSFHASNL